MFEYVKNWLNQRIINRSRISPEEWNNAFKSLPLLKGLSEEERKRLQELSILFMHHKTFEGAHELVINRNMVLIISLQACLPILNLGLASYENFVSVIVYPASFITSRSVTDENGLVHHEKSHLSGEAWQRGPVVLGWDESETAGLIDGHNLVIHEFSHKLDMQNSVANGFPPLHATMNVKEWVSAFTTGFEHFQNQCTADKLYGIDCYAATSPAEFFAVLSEVFFERPDILKQYYAEIYEQLELYYCQSPMERLSGT